MQQGLHACLFLCLNACADDAFTYAAGDGERQWMTGNAKSQNVRRVLWPRATGPVAARGVKALVLLDTVSRRDRISILYNRGELAAVVETCRCASTS